MWVIQTGRKAFLKNQWIELAEPFCFVWALSGIGAGGHSCNICYQMSSERFMPSQKVTFLWLVATGSNRNVPCSNMPFCILHNQNQNLLTSLVFFLERAIAVFSHTTSEASLLPVFLLWHMEICTMSCSCSQSSFSWLWCSCTFVECLSRL